MTRPPGRHPARRGFTLIEAIATIVVLAVIGTGTSMLLLGAVDGFLDGATRAQVHSESSIALDRIIRELRKIELDAAASGIAPDIDTVSPTSITWTDSDDDAWSLALSGTDLLLAVDGGAAATLLTDVTAFSVRGYDESDNALGLNLSADQCDPIRRVAISLTIDREGVSDSLRSRVYLRSTMTGGGS